MAAGLEPGTWARSRVSGFSGLLLGSLTIQKPNYLVYKKDLDMDVDADMHTDRIHMLMMVAYIKFLSSSPVFV